MPPLRILTLVDYYCPGWKAGGPVRAIQHLVSHLGDSFQFDIATSDRDLGDVQPYPGIAPGSWNPVGNARVLYLSPPARTTAAWRALLRRSGDYDLVYLNSLFSRSTVTVLALRRLGLLPPQRYLLAPRGELQRGALSVKPRRKAAWLAFSSRARLYDGIEWQAATPYEQRDIVRVLDGGDRGVRARVHVAPDLPSAMPVNGGRLSGAALPCAASAAARVKVPGFARLVFISRISRKKNLDYALRVLTKVSGRVDFDIYGPVEDERYWQECLALAKRLPPRVAVRYRGALDPADVTAVFANYDLFLFPTRGESFGHVILESLSAGCPVLTSDQTPWRGLAESEAGWDVPLQDEEKFAALVERVIAMTSRALRDWSAGARAHGRRHARPDEAAEASKRLFGALARRRILPSDITEITLTEL